MNPIISHTSQTSSPIPIATPSPSPENPIARVVETLANQDSRLQNRTVGIKSNQESRDKPFISIALDENKDIWMRISYAQFISLENRHKIDEAFLKVVLENKTIVDNNRLCEWISCLSNQEKQDEAWIYVALDENREIRLRIDAAGSISQNNRHKIDEAFLKVVRENKTIVDNNRLCEWISCLSNQEKQDEALIYVALDENQYVSTRIDAAKRISTNSRYKIDEAFFKVVLENKTIAYNNRLCEWISCLSNQEKQVEAWMSIALDETRCMIIRVEAAKHIYQNNSDKIDKALIQTILTNIITSHESIKLLSDKEQKDETETLITTVKDKNQYILNRIQDALLIIKMDHKEKKEIWTELRHEIVSKNKNNFEYSLAYKYISDNSLNIEPLELEYVLQPLIKTEVKTPHGFPEQ